MATTPAAWLCPFCGRHATITEANKRSSWQEFDNNNKYGPTNVHWATTTCPNPECREHTFAAYLFTNNKVRASWQLLPPAKMKVLPEYIPSVIVSDYREACLIAELSPKASATLSRRCLQGMIRDYWSVSRPTLALEIEAIKDKIDDDAWTAITGLRKIGNIGAHMERDINVIVDVDPNEARLLIELIETLIEDWYVARHERKLRMIRINSAVAAKFPQKPEPDKATTD